MMKKKETKGGSRKGAGAKPKYGEPTTTRAFRIPISKLEYVESVVKRLLDSWSL